jgi:CO/xanthine dehydrogenase FAD-binding subunit
MEAHRAVDVLAGQTPTPEVIRAAAEIAASDDIDPSSDIHATAEFRRHLAKVLARRALDQACRRAAEKE